MKNYEYLIAGLPELTEDFGLHPMDYESLVSQVKMCCPKSGVKIVEWFEFGGDPEHLRPLFYKTIDGFNCSFIKDYYGFDRRVRQAKTAFLEGTFSEPESEEEHEFLSVFSEQDILEREKRLDALYWRKIDEMVINDLFNLNVILAFLAKARIVKRWNALDASTGEELFKQLVQEVRGTFKGVRYE